MANDTFGSLRAEAQQRLRLREELLALSPEERAKVLTVVKHLYEIKLERRAKELRYPPPSNCGLVLPPPEGPSTYTQPPPYTHLRLIRGGRP